jgi:hypothetical protein
VHGSSACPGSHSHTVPAAPAWLAAPVAAGGADADEAPADPEPDPQPAASKASAAIAATPASTRARARARPLPGEDAQLGCIYCSVAQNAHEVNATAGLPWRISR